MSYASREIHTRQC